MKLKIIKVFEFNELSEDVKEKVLDEHRFVNVDYDWWDFSISVFLREAKELGFSNIESDDITFKINDRDAHFGIKRTSATLDSEFFEGYSIASGFETGVNKVGYWFSDFPFRGYNSTELSHVEFDEIVKEENGKWVDVSDDEFEEIKALDKYWELLALCKKYFRKLEEEYEYLLSDEAVKETILINEYTFTEEGEILNDNAKV